MSRGPGLRQCIVELCTAYVSLLWSKDSNSICVCSQLMDALRSRNRACFKTSLQQLRNNSVTLNARVISERFQPPMKSREMKESALSASKAASLAIHIALEPLWLWP